MDYTCIKCNNIIKDTPEDKLGKEILCPSCGETVFISTKKEKIQIGISDRLRITKEYIGIVYKKPIFIVPLFIPLGSTILFLLFYNYFVPTIDIHPNFFYISLYFFIAIIISFTVTLLLELIKMYGSENKAYGIVSVVHFLLHFSTRYLILAFIWAIFWPFIKFATYVLWRFSCSDGNKDLTTQETNETLSNLNSFKTWWDMRPEILEKLGRLILFLIFSSISLEGLRIRQAIHRSTEIISRYPIQNTKLYLIATLTNFCTLLIIMGMILMGLLSIEIDIPDVVWPLSISFLFIVFSIGVYFEQMATGLFYLWYLNWEKSGENVELEKFPLPDLLK